MLTARLKRKKVDLLLKHLVTLVAEAAGPRVQRADKIADPGKHIDAGYPPTADEPLVLVIVDELSTLTAYEPDTKLRNRATAAISALLARGRAAAAAAYEHADHMAALAERRRRRPYSSATGSQ